MTPKEKAAELIHKYLNINLNMVNDLVDGIRLRLAQKNALIAVDEILEEYPSFPRGSWEESRALYWLEVKKELKKL